MRKQPNPSPPVGARKPDPSSVPPSKGLNPVEAWIVDRIETTPTGRVVIKLYLVDKYRKMTQQWGLTISQLRSEMVCKYSEFI